MPQAAFIIDRAAGVEIVISSGKAVSYPEHIHVSTFAAGLVRSGEMNLKLEGGVKPVRAGRPFMLFPYQPHSL